MWLVFWGASKKLQENIQYMMSRNGMATFQLVLPSNSILKDLRTGTDGFASLKGTCSDKTGSTYSLRRGYSR